MLKAFDCIIETSKTSSNGKKLEEWKQVGEEKVNQLPECVDGQKWEDRFTNLHKSQVEMEEVPIKVNGKNQQHNLNKTSKMKELKLAIKR